MAQNENNKKITLNKLAGMMQREFLDSKKEMREGFGEIKEEISGVKKEMREEFIKVHDEITWIHGSLKLIQGEISEIKEKLKNIIYRHEFETLKDRIEAIEKKVGIRK